MTLHLKCEWCHEVLADHGTAAQNKSKYYSHRKSCPTRRGNNFLKEKTR